MSLSLDKACTVSSVRCMSPDAPGAPEGNTNAAKPAEHKLSERRTFGFLPAELSAYKKAAGERGQPFRLFVRSTLNKEVGLPPPSCDQE